MLLPLLMQLEMLGGKSGGTGDNNGQKGGTFKPSGLPPTRSKAVEKRVAETAQIQAEVLSELRQKIDAATETPRALDDTIAEISLLSLANMTPAEIDFEIGVLLKKSFRTDDEEALLMILAIAAS